MLKDFNQTGRNLEGENYTGYDTINSSFGGIYVYLKYDNEIYEVCCHVNDSHILESVSVINEKAQEYGDNFGEYIYSEGLINGNSELAFKVIKTLKDEGYIINPMIKENYSITFQEAKKNPIYKFWIICPIERLKNMIKDKDFKDDITVVAVLEFGNIDIEINAYNYSDKVYLEYNICTKNVNYGWESYLEIDTKVELSENIEQDMFNEMIKFAANNNLYWSVLNNI